MIAGDATDMAMDRMSRAIDFAVSRRSGAAPECNLRASLPAALRCPPPRLSGIKGLENPASITIDFERQRHYV